MNSLNILSARVLPTQTPSPSRIKPYGAALSSGSSKDGRRSSREDTNTVGRDGEEDVPENLPAVWSATNQEDEKAPLLRDGEAGEFQPKPSTWSTFPSRVTDVFIASLRWVFTTLSAPGVYLLACLYDERGDFIPFRQTRVLWSGTSETREKSRAALRSNKKTGSLQPSKEEVLSRRGSMKAKRSFASNSSSSGLSSESESEKEFSMSEKENQRTLSTRHSRSKSSDEIAPARRSIRIKLHNEDSLRQRKHRKTQSTSSQSNGAGAVSGTELTAATLKSPTSPASSLSLTKYPRTPAPPRPLIPHRQPSYNLSDPPNGRIAQKTLILDLDETLIHSMAKGGRMSTGHMVEVKLNTYGGAGGQTHAGPQHPILYYVHKRPHCDDFLRRVCKWYNLVIFTASVQEYADPVIDWLETERKFFSGRLYRQHCTYRHGAFIKDLTSVEPDLSKVMILDNSPLSYMFHQDNAIPIEGWISDPTDNDLLHLVPLLEGLQYVTDVRALLALRGGEDGKHMTT